MNRIVATCLTKDSDDRWQTARDLLRELKWVADGTSAASTAAAQTARGWRLQWLKAAPASAPACRN